MKHMKSLFAVALALSALTLAALIITLAAITPALQAQPLSHPAAAISLSLPYMQDFNTLATSGTGNAWTDDSTLSGWYATRSIYIADSGSSQTGALYSFGSSSAADRALGALSSNATGDIYYGVKLINDTAQTINVITVTYTGEQWRNGGNTAVQTTFFAYQVDAASLTAGPWTDVPALDFASPIHTATAGALDGNAAANQATLTAVINLVVAPGQTVMLRWFDPNDSGNEHGLAIDDLSVTANAVAGDLPPIVVVHLTGQQHRQRPDHHQCADQFQRACHRHRIMVCHHLHGERSAYSGGQRRPDQFHARSGGGFQRR